MPPTTARPRIRETSKKTGTPAPATILLAEDEEEVRSLLRELLESQGHKVLEASGPAQGISVAAAYDGSIDLLLTDVVMPGGTGADLARAIVAHRPNVKVLYMSGYPEIGATPRGLSEPGVLEPGVPFLSKPFTRDVLLAKLQELLGHSRHRRS
jgi:hypothetical protein